MSADKKSPVLASLFLACGEDDYLVGTKARELVDRIIPKGDQLTALEIIEGNASSAAEVESCVSRCKAGLSSGGLFSEKKCVWLRDPSFLGAGRAAQSAAAKEAVSGLVSFLKAGLAPDTYLVISSEKVDKRSAFYKLCASSGEVIEFGTGKSYEQERDAVAFVAAKARQLGLQIDQKTTSQFVEKVGISSRLLASELEKLVLYVGDRKTATAADVEQITSSARTAISWDLADAFGDKDLVKTLKVLRRLLYQSESEVGIIIGLELRIRDLMIYREALDKGWLTQSGRGCEWGKVSADVDEFFSSGAMKGDPRKVHPFRAGVLSKQAMNFSLTDLSAMLKLAVKAHERLVTSSESKQNILESLLVRLLRNRRRSAK